MTPEAGSGCPSCGFVSLPGMSFCGMCGTRLARPCPSCRFANPPDYRFCGACGEALDLSALPGMRAQLPPPRARRAARPDSPSPALLFPTGSLVGAAPAPMVEVGASAEVLPGISSTQVLLEGERRMATVILADVEGSTALMEQIGTEAWVSMMNRVFHVLETEIYRYGGVVDQFRGDGLVAFFGTAVAHEDDPERAVLAALAMQDAIGAQSAALTGGQDIDLGLRVGVNTGEVIVASIGDQTQHSEDTAMGEAIALAARLETAAQRGTVLVSANTYHLVESLFAWEPLGSISAKGISQPVQVYRPTGPREDVVRSLRLESYGLTPRLIGREEQLGAIRQRIEELRRGVGSIVSLAGDEGMGKSYLMSEVRQQVLRDEALQSKADPRGRDRPAVTWLHGRCRSYEQSWPYSLWLDLLGRWLGTADEPRTETRRRLREKCGALWADDAEEHYPFLAALLSLPLEEEFEGQVGELEAEGLRQRLFATVYSWIEAMARGAPILLVFEDVYWADATSVDLLDYCLPLCDRVPVLFVLMFRRQQSSAFWDFYQRIELAYPHRLLVLTLGPLTEVQAGEMINALIGSDALSAATRAQIIGKAQGNPYYIEEMIRTLIRDGLLMMDPTSGAWHMPQAVDTLDLPDTLRGLLSARLDALSPGERYTLQRAAIVGTVFWKNVLQQLVGPDAPLDEHLWALQRAQLVQERGRVPDLGMEYAFRSALIRDLTWESVLSAQRADCARQVADYMSGLFGKEVLAQYYDVVAYQYRNAGEGRRELFYTIAAAEHAQSLYANAEAIEFYARALELLGELEAADPRGRRQVWLDWRLESLRGLGTVYFGMGQTDRAEPYLRQAVDLAEEAELPVGEVIRLYYWLCEVLFWQERYEEQIALAKKGLQLLGKDLQCAEAALMNQEVAVGHRASGRLDEFTEFTERTAGFLEEVPYSEELQPAHNHVAVMYAFDRGEPDEALRWLSVLEARATAHRDLRGVGRAHSLAGSVLHAKGDLEAAASRYEQALAIYEKIGAGKEATKTLSELNRVHVARGDLERAARDTERVLDAGRSEERGDDALLHLQRAGTLMASGRADRALSELELAAAGFRQAGVDVWAATAVALTGVAHLDRKDVTTALRFLGEAGSLGLGTLSNRDPLVFALVLSLAERAGGDSEDVQALIADWLAQVPESSTTQWRLEPAAIEPNPGPLAVDDSFGSALASRWRWHDPFGDCEYCTRDGLEIHAANGRDLWRANLSAPRVLCSGVEGDWSALAVCSPVAVDQPAIGGLLAWGGRQDYLRLDCGRSGSQSILLLGRLGGRDTVVGHGLAPMRQGRAYLRLERSGKRLRALCSADGAAWYSVGETAFDPGAPVQVGLYAIGDIERVAWPGAHPAGSAIRFESFRLWSVGGGD